MFKDTVWYSRFADVPGVGYVAPEGIRRPDLPASFLKPEMNSFQIDGKPYASLTWKTEEGGSTSASPASRWSPDLDLRNPPPQLILQQLYEKLELPGVASDYHFALLSAYQALAPHARRNPELYEHLERLCLTDIVLVEHLPRIINEGDPNLPPFRVPAFEILGTLYLRNGLLDDAMGIAKRAVAAGQGNHLMEEVEQQFVLLRAEDA